MNEKRIVIIYKLLNFAWFAIPAILFATPLTPDAEVSLALFAVSLCVLMFGFSKFEKKHSDIIKKAVNKRYHTISMALCFVMFMTFYWEYNHYLLKAGPFAVIILLLTLFSVYGETVLLKIAAPFRKKSV